MNFGIMPIKVISLLINKKRKLRVNQNEEKTKK